MNTVVQKFTADGITVVGGIPSMTTSLEEIESFVTKADALTVNLGTLDAERRKVIRLAIEIANASGTSPIRLISARLPRTMVGERAMSSRVNSSRDGE
nr:hydroxyethylthiazole kinase [Agrobacterium tumefaciens]